MAKICCGATSGVPGRLPKRRCVREKSLEGWRGYGNAAGARTAAQVVVLGLCEEIVYKVGRSELCCAHLADGMAELPRFKPCFLRCSKTVFEAGSGLEAASSTQPADKRRAGSTFAVDLGPQLGWEASEVTEGQARGTHGDAGSEHRRATANELADEASPPFSSPGKKVLAAHLSVLRCCSVQSQRMPEAPVPLPCQDAHRAAPSCVTAPPSLFGGRPCSSWTWSAVSPNVRTGGRRPRCKGKLRLRGFAVCV